MMPSAWLTLEKNERKDNTPTRDEITGITRHATKETYGFDDFLFLLVFLGVFFCVLNHVLDIIFAQTARRLDHDLLFST